MVSIRPLMSKSSSSYPNFLVIVPSAPITFGITVTFMFHSFFNSQSKRISDGNKRVLRIPQSSGITETLPSDCLVSLPG